MAFFIYHVRVKVWGYRHADIIHMLHYAQIHVLLHIYGLTAIILTLNALILVQPTQQTALVISKNRRTDVISLLYTPAWKVENTMVKVEGDYVQ